MNTRKILQICLTVILLMLFSFGMQACQTPVPETVPTETQPPVKQGFKKENGKYYYYNEDGSLFTDGCKTITANGTSKVYFFQEDGSAFTGGFKEVTADGITKAYFFQEDGTAFTGGFKEITLDGATKAYFFQEDGSAFTDGRKEITQDGSACYYYFQEDGSALTNGWQTVGDTVQYFDANGHAVHSTFLTIDDELYYFDDACVRATDCWFRVEDGYYHADENGIIATDTVVEGYRVDATGNSVTKCRIAQLVSEHTDPDMTRQEKIDALYDWVLSNDMRYIRSYEHVRADWVWQDSWVDDMATSQMDNWGGNCFRYAAFFGMLIREATGYPVTVYHGQTPGISVALTPHGWSAVLQDGTWYVYDVELQKFSDYGRSDCYKVPASESYLHLQGIGTDLFS